MSKEIYELKKSEYFKNDEEIFIHRSDNIEFDGVMHKHNFIEIVYVIQGNAIHTVGDMSYPVKQGNVIMIDYGVSHCFSHNEDNEQEFLTYDLLFTPDFFNISVLENNEFFALASSYLFSSVFSEFKDSKVPQNLIKSHSKEFHQLFEKIYNEYTNRETGFQSIIRAYLIEIIIKIFREIDKNRPTFTKSHQELVEKAIEHMRKNYNKHISLDEIASGIFLSKNYFRQIFKKTTGMSISSFMQELRINEACRLLATTDLSSAEVSYKCGFNDVKFFYSTFKKTMGMTPAEYRKNRID